MRRIRIKGLQAITQTLSDQADEEEEILSAIVTVTTKAANSTYSVSLRATLAVIISAYETWILHVVDPRHLFTCLLTQHWCERLLWICRTVLDRTINQFSHISWVVGLALTISRRHWYRHWATLPALGQW
jgi:hypothetical protein